MVYTVVTYYSWIITYWFIGFGLGFRRGEGDYHSPKESM
jgi:hypothetical protein